MSQRTLRYTLLSDGSSDAALLPILTWLLRTQLADFEIQPTWAELRGLSKPPRLLRDRIRVSLESYPCELLFVHRDAENQPHAQRVTEIRRALEEVAADFPIPAVCVVPVRMQEAWMLVEERAIRQAAGNPNGRQRLRLPPLSRLEEIPDPKTMLHEQLRAASGFRRRRLDQFNVRESARRIADFISDFSVLRHLSAFQYLEEELQFILQEQGWKTA